MVVVPGVRLPCAWLIGAAGLLSSGSCVVASLAVVRDSLAGLHHLTNGRYADRSVVLVAKESQLNVRNSANNLLQQGVNGLGATEEVAGTVIGLENVADVVPARSNRLDSVSAWTFGDWVGSIGKSAGACWFADAIMQVKHDYEVRKRIGHSSFPDSKRSATFVVYGLFYFGFARPALFIQWQGELWIAQLSAIHFICDNNAVFGAFVGFPLLYFAAELLRAGVSQDSFRNAMLRYHSTCLSDNLVGASFWIFADCALAHWPHYFLGYAAMSIWCMILSVRWRSVSESSNALGAFVNAGTLESQHQSRTLDLFLDQHVQWRGGQDTSDLTGELMKAADKLRLAAAANTAS